jgi:hypothetical protein
VVQVLSSPPLLPTRIHPLQFNAIGMDACRDGMDGTTSRLFVARGEGGDRPEGPAAMMTTDGGSPAEPSGAAQCGRSTPQGQGAGAETDRERGVRGSQGDIASHRRLPPARCGRSCGGGGRAALNAKNAWAACGPPAARGVAHEACACARGALTRLIARAAGHGPGPPSCSIRSACLQLAEARQTT